MNHVANEIETTAGMAEDLLAACGQMSQATIASVVRNLATENKELRSIISNSIAKTDRLERDVESLTDKCRQWQTITKSRLDILQNQIKSSAAGRDKS